MAHSRLHLLLARPGRAVVSDGDHAVGPMHLEFGQEVLQLFHHREGNDLPVLARVIAHGFASQVVINDLLPIDVHDCLSAQAAMPREHHRDQHL
jgi:hypothetical protein